MSDTTTSTDAVQPPADEKPKHYRYSVLITAIGRLFRSFAVLSIIIVGNAIVQAALIGFFDPIPEVSVTFIVTMLISLAFLIWGFYCFNIVALEGATGKPDLSTVFRRTPGEWLWFILWAAVMYVLVVAGLIIEPLVAIAVLILLPFVSLAAADGDRNPITTNFKVIWQRIMRYIVVVIVFTPIAIGSLFFTSIDGFFIGDALGSFITWIFWGIVGAWYLNALGLIYRSTFAGRIEAKSPRSRSELKAELDDDSAPEGRPDSES